MLRLMVITACGLALAGCASGSGSGFDFFPKAEPVPVTVQFQSEPAGAEAKTSVGESCQTPCALAIKPDKDFAVTFSLAGYQPQTIPVQVKQPEGFGMEANLSPNPVAADLVAAPKGKRTPAKKPATTASVAKPKPAAAKPAVTRPVATSRPTALPPAAAPSSVPPATDPWPPATR